MNFEERILLNESRLTDTDDQIVEYIRDNKDEFMTQSVQKTADKLFTVPNTLVRFTKKLGYSGISDFKYSLKNEKNIRNNEKKIKNIELLPETISKTLELINEEILIEVVEKILKAKKVYFLGIGDSIYFCETFCKYIRCIGIKGEYFNHRHDMRYAASNCNEKDLFIAISVSGESEQILEVSKIAKERKASIISMTHLKRNRLMNLADINLFYWAPRIEVEKYNATDRIGIMMIIRMINEKLWKICV